MPATNYRKLRAKHEHRSFFVQKKAFANFNKERFFEYLT